MRDRVATNTTVTPSATQFLDRLLTAVVKDFRSLDADYRQATGGQKPTPRILPGNYRKLSSENYVPRRAYE